MRLRVFLHKLKEEWSDDQIDNIAAALTFYGVLALFPFLLFLVSLAGILVEPSTWEALLKELSEVAPEAAVQILSERIDSFVESSSTSVLTLSALGVIWAASSGFAALVYALDKVYDVPESRPFWKVRLIAVATTLAAGFLFILASTAMVVTPALADRLPGGWRAVLLWLRLPAAGFAMICVLTLIYNLLPNTKMRFRLITPGSVLGVFLWLLVSYCFSLYLRHFGSFDAVYGTLGGVIVLIFWMWLSSISLLLGAEVNAVLLQMQEDAAKAPSEVLSSPAAEPTAPLRPATRPARSLYKSALGVSLLVLGARLLRRS